MKSIKLSLVAALLVSSSLVADIISDTEVSANVALTSNYVWRGMTQTGNAPAVQGGVDLGYKGAYLGLWGSAVENTKASSEFDVYFGYAGDIEKFSYDIGFIEYMYPNNTDELNFGEAYLTLGYDFDILSVSAMYALGVDTDDVANEAVSGWEPGDDWELGVSIPLPADVTLDGTYGEYDDKGTQNNPTVNNFGNYYSVGITKTFGKFDVNLAYTGMDYDVATNGHDGNGKEDNLVATIGTSF